MDPAIRGALGRLAEWAEYTLTVLCLLLFAQGLVMLAFEPGATADEQPLVRLLWYPAYLFALCMLALRPMRAMRMLAINALALAPVLLAFLSMFWSIEPDVTFRRAIALAFTALFGVYLATRYSWRGMLTLLGVTFSVLAIASFIAALAMPARGVMQEEFPGVWQGVFAHKNELGSMMTRGAVVFGAMLALYRDRQRNPWVWAGLILCVSLVLISTSKTSLLATIGAGMVMLSIILLRRSALSAFVFTCIACLAALTFGAMTLLDPALFFELLGKDPTLTGRTDIWEALMRSIAERPVLGYGYGVFWRDPNGPAWWVREATQWRVPSAHNGWIETTLSLGLVGLIITTIYVMGALALGVGRIWTRRETLFALPYIGVTLVFSTSESIILLHNNMSWVIFVATTAKLFAGEGTRPGVVSAPPLPSIITPAKSDDPRKPGAAVKFPLTLYRVTLQSGDMMMDFSADLAGLAAGLDRTRPADGRGRVIMFTSPRTGTGVSTLSREFARMMARRSPRGVWLFDLDLARNTHFTAFSAADARSNTGEIGPALDVTLGQEPFWRVTDEDGVTADDISTLMTLHRVGAARLFVSRFHPGQLTRGQRVHIRAAHDYWEKLRDTVELAVIDAPALQRSPAGRPLYAEADAVVIVVDDAPGAMAEAEALAETVRERGGLPAGVIVNFARPQTETDRHSA